MPKCLVKCNYCGHIEKTYIYNIKQEYPCDRCKDKNTIIKEVEETDSNPFGYPKDF